MSQFFDEGGNPIDPVANKMQIVLPCDPKDFGDFISSLLGKPQTIEKVFRLPYQLDRSKVSDVFQLVEQRINQQNEAALVQFTVRIIYDDDSTVLLNSIQEFQIYKEVRPLASVGVILSWTYLIKFKNKKAPEKQQIDLAFRSNIRGESNIFEDGVDVIKIRRFLPPSSISLHISHTDRTWGTDIESLLTGYVRTLKIEENRIKRLIRKKSGWIGFTVFALMLAAAMFTAYKLNNKMLTRYHEKLTAITDSTTEHLPMEKVDLLIDILIQRRWIPQVLDSSTFILISFCLSAFFGILVAVKAVSEQHSFVLLSNAAEEHRQKVLRKRNRDWFMFFASLGGSIVTGVAANLLFYFMLLKSAA